MIIIIIIFTMVVIMKSKSDSNVDTAMLSAAANRMAARSVMEEVCTNLRDFHKSIKCGTVKLDGVITIVSR